MNEEIKNINYYRWSTVFLFYTSTKTVFAKAKWIASLNMDIYRSCNTHTPKINHFFKLET